MIGQGSGCVWLKPVALILSVPGWAITGAVNHSLTSAGNAAVFSRSAALWQPADTGRTQRQAQTANKKGERQRHGVLALEFIAVRRIGVPVGYDHGQARQARIECLCWFICQGAGGSEILIDKITGQLLQQNPFVDLKQVRHLFALPLIFSRVCQGKAFQRLHLRITAGPEAPEVVYVGLT